MPPRPSILGPLANALAAVTLAATLAGTASSAARAADLDDYGYADAPQEMPVAQLPQTKVEFGTGWYVRGDLGVDRQPRLGEADGSYVPALQLSSGSDVGYNASLGAGYSFNRYFRADVTADFNKPVKTSAYLPSLCTGGFAPVITGTNAITGAYTYQSPSPTFSEYCTNNQSGTVHSYDVLVNGYVDIAHWRSFTPYVGAGVGLSFGYASASSTFTQADNSSYNFYATDPSNNQTFHFYKDNFSRTNYYNFAFALMAGVAVDVYDHTKLDIGYRYVNEGKILGATLSMHEVRAGLRYMIDN